MIFLFACLSVCYKAYNYIIFNIQNNVIIYCMIYKIKNKLFIILHFFIYFKQFAKLIQ